MGLVNINIMKKPLPFFPDTNKNPEPQKPKFRLYGGHGVTSMYAYALNRAAVSFKSGLHGKVPNKVHSLIYVDLPNLTFPVLIPVIDIHEYNKLKLKK